MTASPSVIATDVQVAIDGRPILTGISLALDRGAVTAIVGPNGAGKSTLLEAIAGVRALSGGRIERRGSIALVVQRILAPEALPVTVSEVVAMGTWARHPSGTRRRGGQDHAAPDRAARIESALARVALDDLADRPFATLSGGQRQRALLAQGLARRSDIFCLDEPASGLDAESRERTQAVLAEEAARGAAVVCVTHDSEAIAAADTVLRLDAGRLVSAVLQECHGSAA